MTDGLSRRCLQGTYPAQRGQGAFAFEPLRIVTCHRHKSSCGLRANAESPAKARRILGSQALEHGVKGFDFIFQRQPALGQQDQGCCEWFAAVWCFLKSVNASNQSHSPAVFLSKVFGGLLAER